MTKQKFFYIITLLAKVIFPSEKAPIETMFASLLSERANAAKDIGNTCYDIKPLLTSICILLDYQKVLANDDSNRRILTEGCINIICEYEKELQRVYCIYNADNIKYGKMV